MPPGFALRLPVQYCCYVRSMLHLLANVERPALAHVFCDSSTGSELEDEKIAALEGVNAAPLAEKAKVPATRI